ncbi:class I SAM-dependent methyltransferase [Enemella evansiae]|uniref:class I SAM-dependent methyltransferase n=1 Tax=Enemella evansiae TaxID=2016499 RepID=UPI00105F8FC9|nr:class I SAM-dependent methyltransferase [Enemella evansiae]TDO91811.1 methyltransferase family protein [Enemella evansiae]
MEPQDPGTTAARAYDQLADDYARLLPDTRAEQPLELAMIGAFTSVVPEPQRVLDAGCGTGRMIAELSARGSQVTGCDISPGMVEHARRVHPELTIEVAPLADLPFGDAAFDGVLLWYSMIHTPLSQWGPAVTEVLRVLTPGGALLIGFQEGEGEKDLSAFYRDLGHQVTLSRWRHTLDEVAAAWPGTTELARLRRAPVGNEPDPQAFLLLRRDS